MTRVCIGCGKQRLCRTASSSCRVRFGILLHCFLSAVAPLKMRRHTSASDSFVSVRRASEREENGEEKKASLSLFSRGTVGSMSNYFSSFKESASNALSQISSEVRAATSSVTSGSGGGGGAGEEPQYIRVNGKEYQVSLLLVSLAHWPVSLAVSAPRLWKSLAKGDSPLCTAFPTRAGSRLRSSASC